MDIKSAIKTRVKIQIIVALLLWCYIIYRAFSISITQDEAHTYLLVKTNNWRQALGTTNTHWLNSFFIKVFLWLPGKDYVWKIRLLSVISWVVYSFAVIKLSSCFKQQWVGFIFFAVAILNPFLIFYFSLARGYAPACALIMLSLWLATKPIRAHKMAPEDWVYVFMTASAAVIANFAAYYFFLALLSVFLLLLLINKKLHLVFRASAKWWGILVFGVSTFSIAALSFIKSKNELYYGGKTDLTGSLFGSLIKKSFSYFYDKPGLYFEGGVSYLLNEEITTADKAAGLIVALLLAIAILYASYSFFQSKTLTLTSFALFSCLGIILFSLLFHIFFKTPYLFQRTALIFYPLLVIGLFCFIDAVNQKPLWLNRTVSVLLSSLLIVYGYNFYRSFSLNKFSEWPVQTHTKECLDYLQSSGAKMVGMNVWHYSVFINYYSKAYPDKYTFNSQVISETAQKDSLNSNPALKSDYLLLAPPYNTDALLKNWSVKLSFAGSGAKVLKNNIFKKDGSY